MADHTLSASRLARGLAGAGFAAAIALAHGAAAQTMNANAAAYNAGFGRTAGEENGPVNVSLTDANGNTTLVNSLIQAPAGSIFGEVRNAVGAPSTTASGGAGDSFTGAGTGSSASAIGDSLNVVVQGDNTIIVNATQTNTGAVTATTTNSGK
jgi:holdfast attachment protein HfaA